MNRMTDVLRPNKTTVLRRQHIIVKTSLFISEEDARNIKRKILEQFEDNGVAVVGSDVDVMTVDADVLAVE